MGEIKAIDTLCLHTILFWGGHHAILRSTTFHKGEGEVNTFGMFSWFGYPMPFVDRLTLIKGAGFDATGFWLGPEEELVGQGKVDRLPDLIRSRDLFLDYVHAPDIGCNDLWSESGAKRERWKHTYSRYVLFCKQHRIPLLVMHVSQSKGEQPVRTSDEGVQLLSDLVKLAEDSEVKLAVENTMVPAYLDRIFANIESSNLGFCYDTSHDFLYSVTPGLLLERWGHRLLATHLADNDGLLDRHWLPGTGTIDWYAVQHNFPLRSYGGSLTLEVLPEDKERESAAEFVEAAYGAVQWLTKILEKGCEGM